MLIVYVIGQQEVGEIRYLLLPLHFEIEFQRSADLRRRMMTG